MRKTLLPPEQCSIENTKLSNRKNISAPLRAHQFPKNEYTRVLLGFFWSTIFLASSDLENATSLRFKIVMTLGFFLTWKLYKALNQKKKSSRLLKSSWQTILWQEARFSGIYLVHVCVLWRITWNCQYSTIFDLQNNFMVKSSISKILFLWF